jgi:hypothetical protein
MRLPPEGGLFFMPVRHARVDVLATGFHQLYVVHDGDWTAAAVCPGARPSAAYM